MGIRVHKCIGYGVADLAFVREGYSCQMTDPRVDWAKLRDRQEAVYDLTPEDFRRWYHEHVERLAHLYRREHPGCDPRMTEVARVDKEIDFLLPKKAELGGCLIHQDEYGLPNVMLVVPPEMGKGWCRYDDSIDYLEETAVHRQANRVQMIDRPGIYPYDNYMIRYREPPPGVYRTQPFVPLAEAQVNPMCVSLTDKHDDKGYTLLPASTYSMLVGRWDQLQAAMATGVALEHFKNDWRPQIPLGVLALLEWYGCFTDVEAFIDSLRPMLYVYWG